MLENIFDFTQRFAQAIGDTTMCNVTIMDMSNRRIAGTGPYEARIGEKIPMGSAFSEACKVKETIIIESPTEEWICHSCSGKEECFEKYEICTPILLNDMIFGVIGIFANTEEQRKYIQNRKAAFKSYVENMSQLLSAYIGSRQLLLDNRSKKEELEAIIENTDQAVLCLDAQGNIKYLNPAASELFNLSNGEEAIAKPFHYIGNSDFFRKAVYTDEPMEDYEWVMESQDREMKTIVASVKRIYDEDNLISVVITAADAMDVQKKVVRRMESNQGTSFDSLIGQSNIMRDVIHKAKIASAYDSTILISGESGTGKELFARAIHRESPRCNGPFISINCSAIPETLLESELFGYESGAFTGASSGGKVGKMELANHGTFFLDEIGDMPLFLQAKLLRVLQDKKIIKIGGTKYLELDIRIIAATNQNLPEMVRTREFREDLYYRLNVIPLKLPTLRQRKSDIPEIAEYFLGYFNMRFGKEIQGFSSDALEALKSHSWPGNVRELENVVEYLVNFSSGPVITLEDVRSRILSNEWHEETLEKRVARYEREVIRETLQEYGDHLEGKQQAAEKLGISLATLYRKLQENSQN